MDKPKDEWDDLVPTRWRSIFNNQDWLMHDIYAKSIYGFLVISFVVHSLCFLWRPHWGIAAIQAVPVPTSL